MMASLLLGLVLGVGGCSEGSGEFVLVDTPKYSFEVPKGWAVGDETPWGARDIQPGSGGGKLGAMTAGPTQASWERLYETSLFFIRRESKGEPTPYRVGKTKQGYECISFEFVDAQGFASKRYVLLRDKRGNALALSVQVPSPEQEKQYSAYFKRMVDSAKLKS